jgi:hypothetical protein
MFYEHLGYFTNIWDILCPFGTFFTGFGITHQEKSGNLAGHRRRKLSKTHKCTIVIIVN